LQLSTSEVKIKNGLTSQQKFEIVDQWIIGP